MEEITIECNNGTVDIPIKLLQGCQTYMDMMEDIGTTVKEKLVTPFDKEGIKTFFFYIENIKKFKYNSYYYPDVFQIQ